MLKKVSFISLFLFCCIPVSAQVSKDLMGLSMQEHHVFLNLPFVNALEQLQGRREQVAQFLQDRIHILKILEEKEFLFEGIAEKDLSLFKRSDAYQEDLQNLTGKWFKTPVSSSAIEYGEYLDQLDPKKIALHLWLFLVGETFGTQSICTKILSNFPRVGKAVKSLQDLQPMAALKKINAWVDTQLLDNDFSPEEYEAEIKIAYDHSVAMFNGAWKAKHVSYCASTQVVLSESYYRFFH